jgi:electron transport complex protein RnfC
VPKRLTLPLQQHIGKPAKPLVRVGERVLKGQLIAQPRGYISASLHASSSGIVTEIAELPVPHPSGLSAPCVVIETDGEDAWADLPEPIGDYLAADPGALRERIRWAGIVGLGGAAFPASVKLNPGYPVETLVLNGAECEPYITCDDMLMRERADTVIEGARILRHLLGTRECLIGIEDNKPEAIASMRLALAESDMRDCTSVAVIPTLYPSGGEKQLIRILTGKEVPSHGLPAQIGVVCQNVATAAAVAEAVVGGRPMISRYVTVTGPGIAQPQNLEVRIGTEAAELIAQCGGYLGKVSRLVLGGPMMGFTLGSDAVPITKAANCLLALTPADSPNPGPALPCIRCGKCAEVCPARLLPQQLYWHARSKDLEKVQDYHLFDCIECGCCALVCPSHIPLVQYYRYAKTESWAREEEKRKAELARQRHEARQSRLDRQEQERKARLRQKAEVLQGGGGTARDDPKKAAIEAAVQRAAAKRASLENRGATPPGTGAPAPTGQRRTEAAGPGSRPVGADRPEAQD